MRPFIFPEGRVWVLEDPEEVAVATLDKGDLALLVFTDDDLATTYASKSGQSSKSPREIRGAARTIEFVNRVRSLGVTHVVVDHTIGKKGHTIAIGKAIRDVEKQIE
jgi:hypothetical protein